eukprot:COSAG04_NODE_29874_length_266_cov_0.616766_1_plen_58_part_10
MKKPKHKDENAMTIPRQRPGYKPVKRPEEYDRERSVSPANLFRLSVCPRVSMCASGRR